MATIIAIFRRRRGGGTGVEANAITFGGDPITYGSEAVTYG